jgi:hypothetical protein
MPASLPVPCVAQGFPLLATAGGQIARPSSQTAPGIKASGPTVSPDGPTAPETEAGGPIVSPGGQTAPHTEAGGPTATTSGTTARPCAAPSLCALPTSAVSRAAPTTSVAPHAASSTPPAPHTALMSMTLTMLLVAPASQLYLLHYSRRPQAAQEPLTPPLHQQSWSVKSVQVASLVNPHPMTT